MNEERFNVVVVGSGTSAHYCATNLNQGGKKVAMVDERAYGGTCALRGCQPKKYLVANAEAVALAKHLVGQGIVAAPRTDWKKLQELKNEFLDGLSEEAVTDFEKAGIKTFYGHATMVSEDTIQVGDTALKGEHIVLATGSIPIRSTIPGHEFMGISDTFLELPELPPRIIFVGGGYISFEFATVTAYAGSRATILHRSAHPLKHFDQDNVSVLCQALKEMGVDVITNESPIEITKTDNGLQIKGQTGGVYEADLIIEATGRTPNLSILDDNNHKVESSGKGIKVNQYLQSESNPRVYAIGDVAATGYQLAPVADKEGEVAAENILNGNTRALDYSVVPSTVFTIPNLAAVGIDEQTAQSRNLNFRVNKGTTAGWPSSKRIGEKHSQYKVLIENGTEKILGAHLVRHNASEVINTFALAIKHGLTSLDLRSMMWAYPTYTSDLKYMVM